MRKRNVAPALVAVVALVALGFSGGCKKEPETIGEHIDQAVDKAKEGAEKVKDKAEDVKDDMTK